MSRSTLTIGEAIKNRGSLHNVTDDVDVPDERIQNIVRYAILHSPTPFNCQSGRAVLLVKEEHKKFWNLAYDAAKVNVAPPIFEKVFAPRIQMFRAGYGTILFYESTKAMKAAQEKSPIVKDKIPGWVEHASGMLQYAVWTMLCAEGLGVSLQHYDPMVDAVTAKQWKIPEEWSLKAQMVFGKPAGPRFSVKEFDPVEDRFKVYGAEVIENGRN